ncbi:MAG: tetratricopeptide repeat protein, partial [Bacteroidota bacterium]
MAKKIKHKARKPLPTRWAWLANFRLVALGLFLLSIVLYANTFGHDYTQDDAIVITDNMYTQEGISGIPGLFTKDTFFGFFKKEGKDRLVSGGRYRPLTPSLFAIEYQLFGGKPGPMHVLNALWYGLTVVVLYGVLLALFRIRGQWDKKLSTIALYWVPLAAAVLFAVHPLHTEAVANIKGRDEIITLLGSLAALWFVLRGGTKHLLLGALCFFGALLAKENAITFLGVVPLALYVFTKDSVGHIVGKTAPLLAAAVLFIVLRGAVIGFQFGEPSQEFMNNPYLKIENNEWVPFTAGEKAATVTYTLGKYAQLLVVPHPLTHDYYPRQVDLKTFGDPLVLLSLFLHLGLLGYGLWSVFTQRSIAGFGILYYLGTLSIVSNIVFPVGTHLSERFLFMPSVGFALVI